MINNEVFQESNPALAIRDVYKSYISGSETLTILKSVTFSVPTGVSVAITGESGSGKSTLLNIIGGLDRADAGSVRVGTFHLDQLSETQLNEYRGLHVGFIFQFHYLLKDFTALENVYLPAYMAGVSKKDAIEKARLLLTDVGMEHRLQHYPSQLSGGERQRVAVARALINNPDVILADEPTGNLDRSNSQIVADLLFMNAEKYHKTLLVVTHDDSIAQRASIQYRLNAGILEGYTYSGATL
ncbi:ABC transporter ATP-binding protein [Gracilinema caldarium]|uniref:Phosphonate-transporting ATPase n=1 Tax=Gracilinema caldarium (strain ATCC 51460 / DSM 7334 / H1) TaxID=744872 RepID=F8F1Q1_GRAC1|nr:ABC transporter ATP-binding protein [Gracilinema caldarium]AEJ19385.1 Phosphonate-transporting ATPase [Gracilinema caldarium DSM 7334]